MSVKLIGAAFVLVGCASVGFCTAGNYMKQERSLQQFTYALDYMQCQLQYRLTPLPELCRQAAAQCTGIIRKVFVLLSTELEDQIHPDVFQCMRSVLLKCPGIPSVTEQMFLSLGQTLGRFDIDGQLKALETVCMESRNKLSEFSANRDNRIRSYQTLGLCAGAAMVILFI